MRPIRSLLAACFVAAGAVGSVSADDRPNVVVIMVDDMGWSDLGCYGGEIRTPHIDALARGGLRFTNFYNTGRCCPTRASLMTGLYPHQAGVGRMTFDTGVPGYRGYLTPNTVTIAEVLRDAGYRTAMVGKWHLSLTQELQRHMRHLSNQEIRKTFSEPSTYPVGRGFEEHYGVIWGVVNYFDPFSLVHNADPVRSVPDGYYLTGAFTDRALESIEKYSRGDGPFFLYLAHCAPHWPLHALSEDIERYKDTYTVGWQAIREARYRRQIEMGLVDPDTVKLSDRFDWGTLWDGRPTADWDARAMACHAAMIDRVDQGVGRIIAKLKELGQYENTIILFLSDNGASREEPAGPGFDRVSQTRDGREVVYFGGGKPKEVLPGSETTYAGIGPHWANTANTPFRLFKATQHEGGIRSPLIVHWPRGLQVNPGSVTRQPGHVIDIMATCLELASTPYPKEYRGRRITPVEGRSLVPIFRGREREGHEALFFEHFGERAVRRGDWKLVARRGAPWELYDLARDASETENLADRHPERARALAALWEGWARRTQVIPGPEERRTAARDRAGKVHPNIIMVIADDMTWRDCEPYGNREVRTPNLSRLASEGLKFNACFTATAMCSPTRQQLYTGVFPIRNGGYPNHSRVYEGTRSIVHHLRALGYRVGLIGKRHIGPEESFPFEFLGGKGAASNVKAIRGFVERDQAQPYCLIVASIQPHTPWDKGPRDLYDPSKLTVPPYLVDTPATREGLAKYYAEITFLDGQVGACMEVVDGSASRDNTIVIFTSEQGSSFPFGGKWTCYDTGLRTCLIVRWPARVRAGSETDAMVQYVDILPTLIEAAGGDPGAADTGLPGAPGGGRGFDGRSFLGVLRGRADEHRTHVFGAHTTRGIINGSESYPIRSVRARRYKYIRNLSSTATFTNVLTRGGPEASMLEGWRVMGGTAAARADFYQHRPAEELYDLERDPWELKNLAGDPALAGIKAELRGELDAWMKQQGDLGVETELRAEERQGRQKARKSRRL